MNTTITLTIIVSLVESLIQNPINRDTSLDTWKKDIIMPNQVEKVENFLALLKPSPMVTAETLQQLFNQALTTGKFPSNLKNADVTPVFKKNNPLNKENYRPVSVLPIISKVFEKLMQNQINVHIFFFCRHTCVVTERALIANML